jgi:hypothetical protein
VDRNLKSEVGNRKIRKSAIRGQTLEVNVMRINSAKDFDCFEDSKVSIYKFIK